MNPVLSYKSRKTEGQKWRSQSRFSPNCVFA